MAGFEDKYREWLRTQIDSTTNPRRREKLESGLRHGTVEFLRTIWYPTVKNFDYLYPELEIRDFHGGYRYIDLAYTPGSSRGAIEIHGFGSHARDLDVRRFCDLCWRHSLMGIDSWTILHVAYPSITEEPQRCKQLVLSFIGRYMSIDVATELDCFEAEAVRHANRLMRPFTAIELAGHLRVSDRHARRILHRLVELEHLVVVSGDKRYRTYGLRTVQSLFGGEEGFGISNGQRRR